LTCSLYVVGFLVYCFAVWAARWVWMHYRGKRLARTRTPVGADEFYGAFEGEEVPREIADVVRNYFRDFMRGFRVEAFPVLPDDDVEQIYRDYLGDTVDDLLELCGREWPPEDVMREHAGLRTVGDVIRFISCCPQAQSRHAT
jgi:hypothetical protein